MGLATKFRQKLRTFMQRPGATVSLAPFEALLPRIEELDDELRSLTDAELTERARELRDRLSGSRASTDQPVDQPVDRLLDEPADDAPDEPADELDEPVEAVARPAAADSEEIPEYVDALGRAQPVVIDDEDLVQICALGREAGRRALDERAFDTQLLGAMSMLAGTVVEMATGEGKTLAAAIAAFGY